VKEGFEMMNMSESEGVELSGSVLNWLNQSATESSKKILSAKQIFKPSSRGFFTFMDGQIHYKGEPGSEVVLYVDKARFPEGLNLMAFELSNFSKDAVDWSFELVIERIDGSFSRLGPFDLMQVKRRIFSFGAKFFSNITCLRFNNLGAVNVTSFTMGFLLLGT
jgi:hypothetical protein